MRVSLVGWLLLASLVLLAGCDSGTWTASAQQSQYNLAAIFKDPKAQALALAAEKGDAKVVHRLMKDEGVNPDVIFGQEGMPLIAWPVFTHSPEGLKAMLENGANPNVKQPYRTLDGEMTNHSNAMVWATKQDDPIYLQLLLDHGGDPNTRNANNETLLFQAFVWSNQWQNVQLLIRHGADVNALSQGMSVLFNYAALGGFEHSYWLLEHGADPTVGHLVKQPRPPQPPIYPIIELIFWYPGSSADHEWQRLCQQWLLQHGYKRPPIPDHMRKMRKDLGFPYEEKDIPLL